MAAGSIPSKGADLTRFSRQLSLDLPLEPRVGREDFLVSPSNRIAFEMIERWPAWPDRALMLIGPPGAGKSHLAAIWAARAGATTIAARDLASADIEAVAAAGAVLLEDADQAPGVETRMFHLLNLARAAGRWVLATARDFPDRWGLATADLLSRLRLAPVVEIGAPDDALVRSVLVKLFADRQLAVEAGLVEFLANRIERSLGAARAIVAALDEEALARGRAISKPLAAELLRRVDDAEENSR